MCVVYIKYVQIGVTFFAVEHRKMSDFIRGPKLFFFSLELICHKKKIHCEVFTLIKLVF